MILLRRHDGYVLRAFWSAFAAALVFVTLLTVVVDLAERSKRLVEFWGRVRQAGYDPALALVRYYATLIPFLWLRVIPIAAPLAAALALARLSRHQELTPLVAGGVSTRRLVLPLLASGLALAGLMVLARATVVPDLNRENVKLGRLLTKKSPDRVADVPHVHDADGTRLSAAACLPLRRALEDAFVTRRGPGGAPLELLRYPLLVWDDEREAWLAPEGGTRIPLDGETRGWARYPVEPGARAPLRTSWFLLEILLDTDNSLGLSLAQSLELTRSNPGNPVLALRHQEQTTLPLSTLVLLGLTIPWCLRLGQRHAPWPGFLVALGMAALFFAASRVAAGLAPAGDVHPVVLAWLPTVLFGSLAAALLAGMRT